MRRFGSESGTIDIERAGSNVTVDHPNALIGKV
jgi:hypothetical protein